MDRIGTGSRRVRGRVKWFDQARGFGFVVAEGGCGDILLHANVLRGYGQTSVAEGARIEVIVQSTLRGAQAESVLSIKAPEPEPSDAAPMPPEDLGDAAEAGPLQPARVKWFDRDKGFGFANVFGSPEDVFVHADVLRRSGLSDLMQGEAVAISIADGRRGKLAVEIRSWDCISFDM